jgi:hypothetical protein
MTVVQSVRQVPQWWTSSVRSTQPTPVHWVRPGRHVQAPLAQTCSAAHAAAVQMPVPEPPQWSGAVVGAMHMAFAPAAAVQLVPAHEQTPAVQTSPSTHCVLQPPHACGSLIVSTQMLPPPNGAGHEVRPVPHVQVPETHVSPGAHALPQRPQLVVLVARSTHIAGWPKLPGQSTWPVGHVHAPFMQVALAGQALPQRMQFIASVMVFAQ